MQPTPSRIGGIATRVRNCLFADIVVPPGLPDFSSDIVISLPEKRLTEKRGENLEKISVQKSQEP